MVLAQSAAPLELEAGLPGGLSPPLCIETGEGPGMGGAAPWVYVPPREGALSSLGPKLVTPPTPSLTVSVWLVPL